MGMWGLLSGSLAGQDHCLYCEFKGRAIVWALQQCRPTSWAMHSSGAAGDSLTVQGCWLCSEVSWGLRLGSAIISGPWKFHATLLAEWCHWLDLAIGQGYQLVSAIVPAWVWSQAVVHQNLSTGCCKPHPISLLLSDLWWSSPADSLSELCRARNRWTSEGVGCLFCAFLPLEKS